MSLGVHVQATPWQQRQQVLKHLVQHWHRVIRQLQYKENVSLYSFVFQGDMDIKLSIQMPNNYPIHFNFLIFILKKHKTNLNVKPTYGEFPLWTDTHGACSAVQLPEARVRHQRYQQPARS